MHFHGYTYGGVCQPYVPDKDLFQDVKHPVGAIENRGSATRGNLPDDVKTVQRLLNGVASEEGGQGGPGGGLKIDGLCGPLTRGAISDFQKRQFPDKSADGIVDPHQRTIARLNDLAYPEVDEILRERGRRAVAGAARLLPLTIAAVGMVQTFYQGLGGLTAGFFASHAKRLNGHFHLDRSRDPLRDLDEIRAVYGLMQTAAAHVPAGPNQKPAFGFVDVRPKESTGKLNFAYAFAGGYLYMQGKSGRSEGAVHRADMIYVTRLLLDLPDESSQNYVILHELAHFVGGQWHDIDHIDDRAYYHRNKKRYDQLSPYEAMTNADTYAQYAWEVNTGQHFYPKV